MFLALSTLALGQDAPPPPDAEDPEIEELRQRVRALEQQVDTLTHPASESAVPAEETLPLDLEAKLHGYADVGAVGGTDDTPSFKLGDLVLSYQASLDRRWYLTTELVYELLGVDFFLDIEEFHVAAHLSEGFHLTAGRMHTPLSEWGEFALHGPYRYTSLDLPGALSLEDEGGPLPMHLVGVVASGYVPVGYWRARYHVSVNNGRAPLLGTVPQTGDTDFGKALLGGVWVDSPGGVGVGGAFYYDVVNPGDLAGGAGVLSKPVTEMIGAAHVSADLARLEVLAEGFWVRHAAQGGPSADNLLGYAQVGVPLGDFTPYARAERTERDVDDLIFREMGTLGTEHRGVVGVRWDVAVHAAIKLQAAYADVDDGTGDHEQGFGGALQLAAGF
ncbi:MAG: hypothetical protein ACOZNI_08585 [Myxococcota bacterium]